MKINIILITATYKLNTKTYLYLHSKKATFKIFFLNVSCPLSIENIPIIVFDILTFCCPNSDAFSGCYLFKNKINLTLLERHRISFREVDISLCTHPFILGTDTQPIILFSMLWHDRKIV